MADRLNGYRILILETREEAQFSRLLTEQGADVLQCPMFTIHDAPDPAPIEAWIRRFIEKPCDDMVLMTGEGLRRLMKVVRRIGAEQPFIAALGGARKFTRGPKPGKALREIGLEPQMTTEKPTSEGVAEMLARLDLRGHRVGLQLYPDKDHGVLIGAIKAQGARGRYRAALCLRRAGRRRQHRHRHRRNGGRPHRCDRADQSRSGPPPGRSRPRARLRGASCATGWRERRSLRSDRRSPTNSKAHGLAHRHLSGRRRLLHAAADLGDGDGAGEKSAAGCTHTNPPWRPRT